MAATVYGAGALYPEYPVADAPASGVVSGTTVSLTNGSGGSLAFGDLCYIKSDGTLDLADANAAGKFPAMAMAAGVITNGNAGRFLVVGVATNSGWAWGTVGGLLYLDKTTPGGMTQTPPSATDDCVQVVGIALSATKVLLNPRLDYVTHV